LLLRAFCSKGAGAVHDSFPRRVERAAVTAGMRGREEDAAAILDPLPRSALACASFPPRSALAGPLALSRAACPAGQQPA
ncbi:MAG: hypothetical protein ACOCVR_01265, partial [Myxococcota bacterium]